MSSAVPPGYPWECRDKEDQARELYNNPLRRTNQTLADENLRLKKILRESGIAWSPIAKAHIDQRDIPSKRRTRSSAPSQESGLPCLPTEVVLRILKFALKSPHPIIDPLSALTPEHLSDKEKSQGNQIAIHVLATCRALHAEGTRYLWESNTFVFTTPQALRNFAELSPRYRSQITEVTLRIIARYYDDQRRKHKLERCYHPDLKKDQLLKVSLRPKEAPLIRGGFRCYAWSQIVDFLCAFRAPFDPSLKDKKVPRPRLLPALSNLRLDLVNFSETLLPFSGSELHDISSHELGCTLNELQVTGMPFDDAGMKASAELSGLLKDEGLYLDGPAAFLAHSKYLQHLSGKKWSARVLRAAKYADDESSDFEEDFDEEHHLGHIARFHRRFGAMPPAPPQEGHPVSTRDEEKVIWKRVPVNRDAHDRSWVQFSRFSGYEITEPDFESDDEELCPCCGDIHNGSSFMGFLSDEFDDEFFDDDDNELFL